MQSIPGLWARMQLQTTRAWQTARLQGRPSLTDGQHLLSRSARGALTLWMMQPQLRMVCGRSVIWWCVRAAWFGQAASWLACIAKPVQALSLTFVRLPPQPGIKKYAEKGRPFRESFTPFNFDPLKKEASKLASVFVFWSFLRSLSRTGAAVDRCDKFPPSFVRIRLNGAELWPKTCFEIERVKLTGWTMLWVASVAACVKSLSSQDCQIPGCSWGLAGKAVAHFTNEMGLCKFENVGENCKSFWQWPRSAHGPWVERSLRNKLGTANLKRAIVWTEEPQKADERLMNRFGGAKKKRVHGQYSIRTTTVILRLTRTSSPPKVFQRLQS